MSLNAQLLLTTGNLYFISGVTIRNFGVAGIIVCDLGDIQCDCNVLRGN